MSFYGSVYYQLIDTFYKIVVKNSGDKTTEAAPSDLIINPSETDDVDIIDSKAQGRNGILQFDSGNKWIQFTQDTSVKADVAGYKVWHAIPNGSKGITATNMSTPGTFKGFKSIGATLPSGKKESDAKELKENDYFYGSTLNYDKAGHVTGVTETLYRLPKTEVTDDIKDLKGDMGYDGFTLSGKGPAKTVKEIEAQSDDNVKSLETLDTYITKNWKNVASYWTDFKPTVKDVIGNMDSLYTGLPSSQGTIYKTHYNSGSSQFKNLVSVIGRLSKLYSDFDPENAKARNVIDSIVELSEKVRKNQKATTDDIDGLQYTLNNISGNMGDRNDRKTVYAEINDLHETIENLDCEDAEVSGSYVSQVKQEDGKISVLRVELPSVTDVEKIGEYVSQIGQSKGKITVKRTALPSFSDSATNGQYVSAVTQTNGQINVQRKDLPTYTLTTGVKNGTVSFNNADVAVKGLGSAAYTSSDAYDSAGAADLVRQELEAAKTTITQRIDTLINGVDSDKIDGLNDLIAYVEEHSLEDVGTMQKDIDSNATNITNEINRAKEVEAQLRESIEANTDTISEEIRRSTEEEARLSGLIENNAAVLTGLSIQDNKVANAKNSDALGSIPAENYLLKADAVGYDDILTKAEATGYNDILTKAEAQSTYIKQITSGTESGTIAVDGVDVAVTNLGSAAFTDSAAYDAAGSAAAAIETAATDATGKVDALKNGEVKNNADAIAAIESDFENITTIIGDVSNLENAPEGGQDVLSWLTHLSTELVRIKQKINELHTAEGTDVPFPEVENSQSSEEEEVITE